MKYSIWQNIKYRSNYSKCIVHLQADLELIPLPKDIFPLYVKELDVNNESDLKKWSEIVTDAYGDAVYDISSAKQHIHNHLFLKITNVYFVMDGAEPVATISIGRYKNNPEVGGDARIAVSKNYQGRGLGKFVIAYGYTKLREQGVRLGESIISVPRKQSILLHYQCGFFPQYNKKYFQYSVQKRYWFVHYRVNKELKKLYKEYISSLSEKFINRR